MTASKDYYDEGRRDANYGDDYSVPHDSFIDRLFWDKEDVRDRQDYRDGWKDGGGSSK